MSADNKAHMRRFIEEGWNEKNPAAFDGRIAAEFVTHTPNGDFRGPDGYKQLYHGYVTAFPDCHFTIDNLIAEGDTVSLSYTFSGTHTGPLQEVPPTGKRVSIPGVSVSRVVDGTSVEENVVWDQLGLMQQLGLAPWIGWEEAPYGGHQSTPMFSRARRATMTDSYADPGQRGSMHSIRPRFLLAICALLLPLTVACERPAEDADTVVPVESGVAATADAPPPGVTAARDRFEAAWNGDDPVAVAAFLTEDATATPGDSTYQGRAEIERGWIRPVLPARSDVRMTSTSMRQVGDDWRDEGRYSVTVHTPEGEMMPEEGHYSITWTRGAGSDWQIRSMDVQADPAPQS